MKFTPVDFDPFAKIAQVIPTSESQREILSSIIFGDDAANCAYNESISVQLKGKFNYNAIVQSVNAVIDRHGSLRATFIEDGTKMQIAADLAIEVPLVDLSSLPHNKKESHLNEIILEDVLAPFDLINGPLIEVKVVKLSEEFHYLLVTAHHIICDGWSMGILMQDLSKFYNLFAYGKQPGLESAVQFEEYIQDELKFQKSDDYNNTEAFWLNLYKDYTKVFEMPVNKTRPALRTYNAERFDIDINEDVVSAIKKTGAKNGCSFVNTLISAFEVFLYRITRQSEIVVGLPAAGQSVTGKYSLVGHCVNLLPLKTKVDGSMGFSDYLKLRRKSLFDAFENQRYTFGTLIKKLNVPRDPSRIPLVPVAFNIDLGLADGIEFEGLEMELLTNPRRFENFEIFLNATGQGGRLSLECTYNTDLYDAEMMRNRVNEFSELLNAIVRNPEEIIDNIDLLPQYELQLFDKWNDTDESFPHNKCLQELFEAQAEKTPNAIALQSGNERISYSQLNACADDVAGILLSSGLQQGSLVALCVERTAEIIISMLGILKAGGAYLPIDPEFPEDRIQYMLENSEVRFIITQENINSKFNFNCGNIFFADKWNRHHHTGAIKPGVVNDPEQLAYVLYTSGSTGKPKGVMIKHISLVNLLVSFQKIISFTSADKLLAVTTISFDIAELEIYLPLITGGTIVLATKEDSIDARRMISMLTDHKITFMQATPSTWRMLIESGWQGDSHLNILCGGEALPVTLAKALSQQNKNVWNVYGPTETTVWSSTYKLPVNATNGSPANTFIKIGKPIANTTFYILDSNLKQLPAGVEGDIYIGGIGLAKGYLNRPDLTEERFIINPFDSSGLSYIYKTGDLGKYQKDGNIEYVGRSDFQVKVHGYRIELGEIQNTISQVDGVTSVAVVARPDKTGDNRLVAYLTVSAQANHLNEKQIRHIDQWKDKWDIEYDISGPGEEFRNRNFYKNRSKLTIDTPESIAEAKEQVSHIVETIKKLNPHRVLEIGCGTGDVMMELAPVCEFYHAVDYSQNAISQLQLQLNRTGRLKNKILLEARSADNFTGIADESFDTIIINSVIEYFPDLEYLKYVTGLCLKALKPGGCLFIGDVRSFSLLEMFNTNEVLRNIDSNQQVSRLRKMVQKRIAHEELTADPQVFESIKLQHQSLIYSEYKLRNSRLTDDGAKYRYDVFLFKEKDFTPVTGEVWKEWDEYFSAIIKLQNFIEEKHPEVILLKNISNLRLLQDHHAYKLALNSKDEDLCKTIIEQKVDSRPGIDHYDLAEMGKRYGYEVDVFWTYRASDSKYDAAFIRKDKYAKGLRTVGGYFAEDIAINRGLAASNALFKTDGNDYLIGKVKEHLAKKLPNYMIPPVFNVLEKMPLTENGKIDIKALPEITDGPKDKSVHHVSPVTETEKLIAAIWEKLLNVKDVGTNDNFFQLGGHSIVAVRMMIEIENARKIRLPLAVLFTNPTIEKLAHVVDNEIRGDLWRSIAPIRTSGSRKPFFFAHGVSGNVFKYHALGQLLSDEIPSYGLQAKGLNGIDTPISDLEDMAFYHIKEILKIQPDGPYFLGGGSFGGALAYEIACHLRKMGKEVAMVVLFDVEAATKSEVLKGMEKQVLELKLKSKRLVSRLRSFASQSINENLSYLKNKVTNTRQYQDIRKRQINEWLNKELITEKYGATSADYFNNVEECCYKALENYQLKNFDGHALLVRAKNGFFSPIEYNKDLGWEHFVSGKVDVEFVPGNHNSIFDFPNVPHLATVLMKYINAYYSKHPVSA